LLSVGPAFFVVSTSAPLLQRWFADTHHPAARDPYFLYAASNLGSMVGLNGYLLVIEPWLRLADQRRFWQVGYVLLAVLTAVCAVYLWRSRSPDKETRRQGDKETNGPAASGVSLSPCLPVSLSRRLRWLALA